MLYFYRVNEMPKTYKISEEQLSEIKRLRKENADKNTEKRLRAVQLRGEGLKNSEIAVIVESHPSVVSRWFCIYVKSGINALMEGRCGGNNRNLSLEEEAVFINEFKTKAEKGHHVTAKEIKIAYCEKIGRKCGNGQIYRVLKRQKWRKVVPRKEHPNKASDETIDATKKLTFV
jgi:transposase